MILYFMHNVTTLSKVISVLLLVLLLCLSTEASEPKFETITWEDLMPKEELEILLNPPSYIVEAEEGSTEDQVANPLLNAIDAATNDQYQLALVSTNVVAEMNNKAIRIAGFIVPLEFNDKKAMTQFFIVPYFGACIHVPPPPPNQIVLVNYPRGLQIDELYRPYWILGVLKTSITKKNMGTSAYTIDMQKHEEYKEEG